MKTVFVTGTNRGLGLGFVKHLLKKKFQTTSKEISENTKSLIKDILKKKNEKKAK